MPRLPGSTMHESGRADPPTLPQYNKIPKENNGKESPVFIS